MAGKGNVHYQRPGALVRVISGDGEIIPSEPQPSTDAEYVGRIGVNIGDGGLGASGEFRMQWVRFSDGGVKAFRGWQLEWVNDPIVLESLRKRREVDKATFAKILREWLGTYDTRD